MAKIRGVKPDFWTDEDVVELSRDARLLFIGLWNFACDNGHIQDKPRQIKMRILPGDDDVNCAELLRELATSGVLERVDGWIVIPNLTFHQKPDKRYFTTCDFQGCEPPEQTLTQREARRAHPVHTKAARRAHAFALGDGDGDGDGEVITSPIGAEQRPEVIALCHRLAKAIEANGSAEPSITKAWLDAARLLLDKDERTVQQVEWIIDWSQDDEFWRANILSMPTLRKQFDKMRLKAVPATAAKPKVDPNWALR